MTMVQSKGLRVFLRDECANYGKHDEACVFGDSCKVTDGQRCDCFEKSVLGPPDYKLKSSPAYAFDSQDFPMENRPAAPQSADP